RRAAPPGAAGPASHRDPRRPQTIGCGESHAHLRRTTRRETRTGSPTAAAEGRGARTVSDGREAGVDPTTALEIALGPVPLRRDYQAYRSLLIPGVRSLNGPAPPSQPARGAAGHRN